MTKENQTYSELLIYSLMATQIFNNLFALKMTTAITPALEQESNEK